MPHSQSSNGSASAASVEAADLQPRRRGIAGAYIAAMDWISCVTGVIAAILLFTGVLAVCHMVFVRFVLNESTVWQTEYAIYSITGAMLLGSPYVLLTGGHVAVTALLEVVSDGARRVMQFFASLVGFVFCVALAYASWHYTIEAYTLGWGTGTVWDPPLWLVVAPMAVGSTLLALQYIAELLRGEN
jgi:TRAP-type C4-dicarboxylate transport system permease small subunit